MGETAAKKGEERRKQRGDIQERRERAQRSGERSKRTHIIPVVQNL